MCRSVESWCPEYDPAGGHQREWTVPETIKQVGRLLKTRHVKVRAEEKRHSTTFLTFHLFFIQPSTDLSLSGRPERFCLSTDTAPLFTPLLSIEHMSR